AYVAWKVSSPRTLSRLASAPAAASIATSSIGLPAPDASPSAKTLAAGAFSARTRPAIKGRRRLHRRNRSNIADVLFVHHSSVDLRHSSARRGPTVFFFSGSGGRAFYRRAWQATIKSIERRLRHFQVL